VLCPQGFDAATAAVAPSPAGRAESSAVGVLAEQPGPAPCPALRLVAPGPASLWVLPRCPAGGEGVGLESCVVFFYTETMLSSSYRLGAVNQAGCCLPSPPRVERRWGRLELRGLRAVLSGWHSTPEPKPRLCLTCEAVPRGWRVCGGALLLSLQKVFERGAVSSGGTEDVAREQGRLGSVRPVAGGFVGCSEQDAAGRPLETDEARSFGDLLRAHS